MLRSEYDATRDRLNKERQATFIASQTAHKELSALHVKEVAIITASGSTEECETEREALQRQVGEILARRNDIDDQLKELDIDVIDGFNYGRPKGWLNRFLPPVPESAMEVESDIRKTDAESPWVLTTVFAVLAAVFTVAAVLASPWLTVGPLFGYVVTSDDPTAVYDDKMLGMTAGFALIGAWILLAVALKGSVLGENGIFVRQLRFFYGATSWTFPQKLRACAIYGISTPLVLICPLLLIPITIGLGGLRMFIYTRHVKAGASVADAVHAAAYCARLFGRFMAGFAGVLLLFVAYLQLSA